MAITLAFDVYGTLIDTAGVSAALRPLVSERAADFARYWREKQLEYSFHRALMQNYRDFSACTRQALDYTCEVFGAALNAEAKSRLMELYKHLPAFPHAACGLRGLKQLPLRLFAFSNGRPDDVAGLLQGAGVLAYFADVISLFEIQTFKPNPAAYAYFQRRAQTQGGESWLISSNPFDVIGAISCGMRAAWIKRSPNAIFDSWEIRPTLIAASLDELASAFYNRLMPA